MGRRIFTFVFAVLIPAGAIGNFITQKNAAGGVTVAVTAGNLAPEATVWDFAVVLRASENKVLSDDLVKNAVLVASNGVKYTVLAWEGAAPEPNHRAGVLKFIAVSPRPDWIELRITRPGEKKPRVFSWLLGSGLVASK